MKNAYVRIPDDLHAWLAAQDESMNSIIVRAVEDLRRREMSANRQDDFMSLVARYISERAQSDELRQDAERFAAGKSSDGNDQE